MLNLLTSECLGDFFSEDAIKQGFVCFNKGRVEEIEIAGGSSSMTISALVGYPKPWEVDISISLKGNKLDIEGDCDCSSTYYCTHMAAAIYEMLELRKKNGNPALPQPDKQEIKAKQWLDSLENTLKYSSEPITLDPTYELHFLLHDMGNKEKLRITVEPVLLRRLKSGKTGGRKNFSRGSASYEKHVRPNENKLLTELEVMSRAGSHYHNYRTHLLEGSLGQQLLPELLRTNRCLLADTDPPLTEGPSRNLALTWELTQEGHQQLVCDVGIPNPKFFYIEGLWYFNKADHTVGPVQTDVSKNVLEHFMLAPVIPASYVPKINNLIQKQPRMRTLPRLKMLHSPDVLICTPVPCLTLKMQSMEQVTWQHGKIDKTNEIIPVAILTFQYENSRVSWHEQALHVTQTNGDTFSKIARDHELESQAFEMLQNQIPGLIETSERFRERNRAIGHYFYFDQQNPLIFSNHVVPQLREAGWIIDIAADYAYQIIDTEISDLAWFANIEDGETSDWFNLELGITVDNQKINLLPIISKLLKELTSIKDIEYLKNDVIFVPTPTGQFVPVEGERIQHIAKSLVELFNHQALDENEFLRLSKCQAARLHEIEKAGTAAELRWYGGEKMRVLGKKISEFKSVEPALVPEGFQGTLRAYQHDGLSWLQFLREYELAGILADDMGLGKTIQTLAHILLEKESGRMTSPTLVIAPTSLMYNWEKESGQFAPGLKVCMLHGANRKQYFESLAEYDLILTTYPLILRDKNILLKQHFHLLILDEAQYIKNTKNLATQIVIQLSASHRLCLTGTPMENHLGELWSLYHFLMPGLLGSQKFFTRHFRTPIEKHADNEQRQTLNNRLAPFLLRRTKDAVVKELPPKTEIIKYVELEGAQRDLYETIRLAMDEKVRKEVEKLGLSRSHIVILDALLKLRQVCCDPRLLKMDSPIKSQAGSAKMTLLAEMLRELVDEGRRIILFSQFTGMLALIEDTLDAAKIPFVKLTGQTKDRKTPIEAFQNKQVPVFLISLKAGGTGLNLTAADTVIHYDPWWNPAVENQATDRAHRIGQDKPVFVFKMVIKGSVEEKIIAMQAKKQALADSIYSDKSTGKSTITEQDLKTLFAPLD